MKKALTIYIDDDAELTRICGTFVVKTKSEGISANFVNEGVERYNAVYFPKIATDENPIKFFKEAER